jgi:hypothetical protein
MLARPREKPWPIARLTDSSNSAADVGSDEPDTLVAARWEKCFRKRTAMAKIGAVGISWYRKHEYVRVRRIMVDTHALPPTYEVWRWKAESEERRAQARGVLVIRAIIGPKEFLGWCARNGLRVDATARTAFAAEVATRRMKDTH